MRGVAVRSFATGDAEAFASLNLEWIEKLFEVEESDRRQLLRPQDTILAQGGAILMAELGSEIVGTGAIVAPHHEPNDGRTWMEVVKMATTPAVRGKGVGGMILDGLISLAKSQGIDALWLETNSSLDAATRLYRKHGFIELEEHQKWPTPYERCNLQMALVLPDK